jgi:hypothetical protein
LGATGVLPGSLILNGGTDNVVENNVSADGKQHQIQWNPWRGYVMQDNRWERNIFAYISPIVLFGGFQDARLPCRDVAGRRAYRLLRG